MAGKGNCLHYIFLPSAQILKRSALHQSVQQIPAEFNRRHVIVFLKQADEALGTVITHPGRNVLYFGAAVFQEIGSRFHAEPGDVFVYSCSCGRLEYVV